MSSRTRLLFLGVLAMAATVQRPLYAHVDPPETGVKGDRKENPDDPSINVFLNLPADLEELLKRLKDPDFRLMREDAFRKQLEAAPAAGSAVGLAPAIVESVVVQGDVKSDLAALVVDYGVVLTATDPTWVPIRLDDQNLIEASEGERVLPLKNVPGQGWQVELSGKGKHSIRLRLNVRLKSNAEGSRLDFAIPEATSTRFQLDIPQLVTDAVTGANEPLIPEPIAKGARTRLAQTLTPRARLDVSWRVEAERAQLPPLLSIHGEIAVDVDPGSFRTRSSWMIYAVRGTERSLEFLLDPEDEVLELELDGQHPPAGIERVDGATRLTINLSEPLRPGTARRLVMATRRPLSATQTARVSFGGFPLSKAREQIGMIGIAKTGNLWVQPFAGRGLRQLDPRELPEHLRVRPATLLAYQFGDQPFELSLKIEPYPPLVSTNSRTRIALGPRQARVESWIDYQTARGRLFEVSLALPKGLELESVGPADLVESSKISPEGPNGLRLLNILLTPKARERSSFSIVLAGRQAIDPTKPVAIDLFQPRETTTGEGRIALVSDRSLTVELPEAAAGSGGAEDFRTAASEAPANWPWPSDRATSGSAEAVALWLRHDGNPAVLPLRVAVHPRLISHRTALFAQVDRGRVGIRQETICSVRFGGLSSLEVLVPPSLQSHWELDAEEVSNQEDLGIDASGDRIVRLRFAREVTDKVRLKFQSNLALAKPLEANEWTEVSVPWIRVREGTSEPIQVSFETSPGIELLEQATGWERLAVDESASDLSGDALSRFTLTRAESQAPELRISAKARPVVELPSLVVPRLWIRTVQGTENQTVTTAMFLVESTHPTLALSLPLGAEWVRARVGDRALTDFETLPQSGGYRLRLPGHVAAAPILVEIEYLLQARLVSTTWVPFQLLDGGVIQETLWEVRVPSNRSVVGVPRGWTDENEWFWDRYVWRRRPWMSAQGLASWVSGSSAQSAPGDAFEGDGRSDYRSYLFGRTGSPSSLHLVIVSWATLVAFCSGAVLLVGGLLFMFARPPYRLLVAVIAVFCVAVAAAFQPSIIFLTLQSGAMGGVLLLIASLIHRYVGRRRPAHSVFGTPNRLVTSGLPGSSVSRQDGAGSDDSTAIRARPASTIDHGVTAPVPEPESASGRSSASSFG